MAKKDKIKNTVTIIGEGGKSHEINAERIFVINAGGEISAEAYDLQNPPKKITMREDSPVPDLCEIKIKGFDRKRDYIETPSYGDSTDTSPKDMEWISKKISEKKDDGYTKFLIIHGTGKMAANAKWIQGSKFADQISSIVIFTGSFDPYSINPTKATNNIHDAVDCLNSNDGLRTGLNPNKFKPKQLLRVWGVNIVMDGLIYHKDCLPFVKVDKDKKEFYCDSVVKPRKVANVASRNQNPLI